MCKFFYEKIENLLMSFFSNGEIRYVYGLLTMNNEDKLEVNVISRKGVSNYIQKLFHCIRLLCSCYHTFTSGGALICRSIKIISTYKNL